MTNYVSARLFNVKGFIYAEGKLFTGQMHVYIGNEKLPVSRALKSLFKGM